MNKRAVLVLDSLRDDCVQMALSKCGRYDIRFFSESSIDTREFYCKYSRIISSFDGWKGFLSGGGFASLYFRKSDFNMFSDKSPYPIMDFMGLADSISVPDWKPIQDRALLVVHDFFIHNWFRDLGLRGCVTLWKVPDKVVRDKIREIYKTRVSFYSEAIGSLVNVLVSSGWDVHIINDHGEAFWDYGNEFAHGDASLTIVESTVIRRVSELSPRVATKFIATLSGEVKETYEEVFS